MVLESRRVTNGGIERVQMGMLSSRKIPRLLPVHIREVDRATLHFDISGADIYPRC